MRRSETTFVLFVALLKSTTVSAWSSNIAPESRQAGASAVLDRRKALAIGAFLPLLVSSANAEDINVIKTNSGLKYLDLVPGTGPSPEYGNMVTITYKGYVKLPANAKKLSTEPQLFDQVTDGFLFKHGSGRMIPGLDEGLHTMKEGGTRRILIPPKLGFVDIGLGPLPVSSWKRAKLNKLLDQMVEVSGGTLIYEVTLNGVYEDEVDQGYYTDLSLTPEQYDTLRTNLQRKSAAARLEEEAAENQPKGADKVM